MARLLVIPEVLRLKLGNDGAKELVDLINQASQGTKESIVDVIVDRFERRLAETKTELVRWMFIFWAGQIVVMIGILSFLFRK